MMRRSNCEFVSAGAVFWMAFLEALNCLPIHLLTYVDAPDGCTNCCRISATCILSSYIHSGDVLQSGYSRSHRSFFCLYLSSSFAAPRPLGSDSWCLKPGAVRQAAWERCGSVTARACRLMSGSLTVDASQWLSKFPINEVPLLQSINGVIGV